MQLNNKKTTKFKKMGKSVEIGLSPKEIHRWLISTWKRSSEPLVSREMEIKTTVRRLFTPTRTAVTTEVEEAPVSEHTEKPEACYVAAGI